MKSLYTSVFDDGKVVCTSDCDYDEWSRVCSNIDTAKNEDAADRCNFLSDEYVTLPNGDELRLEDGVIFEY